MTPLAFTFIIHFRLSIILFSVLFFFFSNGFRSAPFGSAQKVLYFSHSGCAICRMALARAKSKHYSTQILHILRTQHRDELLTSAHTHIFRSNASVDAVLRIVFTDWVYVALIKRTNILFDIRRLVFESLCVSRKSTKRAFLYHCIPLSIVLAARVHACSVTFLSVLQIH